MATTADYLNKLVGQKNTLADNLTTKGVTAAHSETLETLVPKVLEINGGETTGYISDGLILFSELNDEIAYNPISDEKIGRKVNNCNEVSGYVSSIANDIASQMSAGFTLQALVRTTQTSSTQGNIFGVVYEDPFRSAVFCIKNGYFGLERASGNIMTESLINDNEWHMLTAVYDGTTMRLYVDGVNVSEYEHTWRIPSTARICIGQWYGTSHYQYVGSIANACIYNRALSDTEIVQNWNVDVERYGIGG